jgi:hypothetical protein
MVSGLGDIMSEKEISQQNGRNKSNVKRRKDSFNDGLTSCKRRQIAIKKAANGKWWIEQYIQASLYWRDPDELRGLDDE